MAEQGLCSPRGSSARLGEDGRRGHLKTPSDSNFDIIVICSHRRNIIDTGVISVLGHSHPKKLILQVQHQKNTSQERGISLL